MPVGAAKPRRRWIVVLSVVLGLVLAITVAGSVLFVTQTLPPLRATWDFTDDIHDRRIDAAYRQVCDRLRTPSARSNFESFARRLSRADRISVDVFSVDRDGDRATVEFDAKYGSAEPATTRLRLVHEHGDWRPCGARTD